MLRLVVLQTSPRAAPGQLTTAAWRHLAVASAVLAAPDHPGVLALALEGLHVQTVDDTDLHTVVVRLTHLATVAPTPVVWLAGPEGDEDLVSALREGGLDVTVVVGSVDLPGARLLDLVAVMDRLRSPGGCPWDAAQTHASLLPYLLEEAYEMVEAVDTDDRAALREELGDVLLQVVFHSRVAAEDTSDPWDIDDVASDIAAKLVRRHPHVFADGSADTAAEVEAGWETLKRVEKGRTSAVEGVPLAQPALALAAKLMSRAEKAGLAVPLPETYDLRVGPEDVNPGDVNPEDLNPGHRSDEEIGDLLLAVVSLARGSGVDPEAALRSAARRYAGAIKAAERLPEPPPPTL